MENREDLERSDHGQLETASRNLRGRTQEPHNIPQAGHHVFRRKYKIASPPPPKKYTKELSD